MRKALIIASEVRSGSTFVAESIAYHFNEVFGDVLFGLTKESFADLHDASSHTDILAKFNSLYLGKQGWIATKIMCAGLSVIVRESRKHELLREAFFGSSAHWIILRRRRKIRQAVSLAYAKKTGDWHVYTTERTSTDVPKVTYKDTEDALRSILFSDTYLESFTSWIPSDNKIEVFYEDFLSEPSRLIDHVYDVLDIPRPSEGVKYVDRTKIRRAAIGMKRQSEGDFSSWLLENYHPVDERQPSKLDVAGVTAQASTTPTDDFRLAIVLECTRRRRSIRSVAEKYGIDASLVSYWIAKHKHGELQEQSKASEDLTFFKGKVAILERQVEELKRRSRTPTSVDKRKTSV